MIDISKMGNFAQISGDSATIYNQGVNGEIKSGGTYRGPLGALRRSKEEKAANNAARSELLVALSKTYGMKVDYKRQTDGRIQFSENFVADLKKKIGVDMAKTLGLDSKFEMKDGYVVCGKPLTERRISAVTAQMRKEQASDVKNAMANLGLKLGMIDHLMLANVANDKKGADQFIEDLISITGGDPDLVTEETAERAVRSSYGKVRQWYKSRGELGFKGDVKDPFNLDTPATKCKKLAEVVAYAKKIIQARGGKLLVEQERPIAEHQQLAPILGQHPDIGKSTKMTMALKKEAEVIEGEQLPGVCNRFGNLSEASIGQARKYIPDECVRRHQTWTIGDETLTAKSLFEQTGLDANDPKCITVALEKFDQKLTAFFTREDPKEHKPVVDEAAKLFLGHFVKEGFNFPSFVRPSVGEFRYMPTQSMETKDRTEVRAHLSHLPNGHYNVTFEREFHGFQQIEDYIKGPHEDAALLRCKTEDVDKNYYSESYSFEFYVNEEGQPVVHLNGTPEMQWKFADSFLPVS